ncbi:MAG: hypothetical protein ACOCX5_06145 [Chloroflexota bacterium]
MGIHAKVRYWHIIIIATLMSLIGVGYLVAQNEDLDELLTCDPDDLLFEQIDAHASLDTFGPDLVEDPEATLERLYDVGVLYQELALDCGHIPENAGELFVGADVERILTVLETMNGDPINGQLLYNGEAESASGSSLGCIGCHLNEDSTGPATSGTWTRWDEIRSQLRQFEDYTFDHYIVESIIQPGEYIVPDYENIMPDNYGDQMSYQDLADIIAYLSSQDQLLPSN